MTSKVAFHLNVQIAASSWTFTSMLGLSRKHNASTFECFILKLRFFLSFVFLSIYRGMHTTATVICFLHQVESSSYLFKVVLYFLHSLITREKLELINSSHFLRGKQIHKFLFLLSKSDINTAIFIQLSYIIKYEPKPVSNTIVSFHRICILRGIRLGKNEPSCVSIR